MNNFMNPYPMNMNNFQFQQFYNNNVNFHKNINQSQNILLRLQPGLLGGQVEPQEKYKTELCKNWEKQGSCPYGEKCRFAHGKIDLKIHQLQQENFNYKSKDCLQYHKMGTCSYGLRCLFKHDERTVQEIQMEFRIQEKYQNSQNPSKENRRLSFFEKLAPSDNQKDFSDLEFESTEPSIGSQEKDSTDITWVKGNLLEQSPIEYSYFN